ncbi:hypothetical protein [uncultured Sphingomonas sp.]|uniref:hypothetical protein n=1 Tax=uncultured Sphingomonas sp. TaxID=158754 RepID=UPI0025F10C15|nr:hypothetical protein [uncultured Sphingomonas sp.]
MSLLVFAFTAMSSAEPCADVRREQGAFTGRTTVRIEQLNRALRRPDGSHRSPTAKERREFAAVEVEVEEFITRFNSRLSNCRGN